MMVIPSRPFIVLRANRAELTPLTPIAAVPRFPWSVWNSAFEFVHERRPNASTVQRIGQLLRFESHSTLTECARKVV